MVDQLNFDGPLHVAYVGGHLMATMCADVFQISPLFAGFRRLGRSCMGQMFFSMPMKCDMMDGCNRGVRGFVQAGGGR